MNVNAILNREIISNRTVRQLDLWFTIILVATFLISALTLYLRHNVLQQQADQMFTTDKITIETKIPMPDGWLRVFLRCERGGTVEEVILNVRPTHKDLSWFNRTPAGSVITFDKELRPFAPHLKYWWPNLADYLLGYSATYPYPIKQEEGST